MYKGLPDIETFSKAVELSTNPVCYNGDIWATTDYEKKVQNNTKINSVMIGRGLIANPNLVNEIKGGKPLTKEQLIAYHDRLYNDFEKIMKADKHLLFKMKEFWNYVSFDFEDSHNCAKKIRKCQNLYKYNLAKDEIFEKFELHTYITAEH